MLYTRNPGTGLVRSLRRDDSALTKVRIVVRSEGKRTLTPCLRKRIRFDIAVGRRLQPWKNSGLICWWYV